MVRRHSFSKVKVPHENVFWSVKRWLNGGSVKDDVNKVTCHCRLLVVLLSGMLASLDPDTGHFELFTVLGSINNHPLRRESKTGCVHSKFRAILHTGTSFPLRSDSVNHILCLRWLRQGWYLIRPPPQNGEYLLGTVKTAGKFSSPPLAPSPPRP